ncbi:MAG TPA: protein-disulfide reductase DsbD domain-containing protein [Lichenihabitans sp.]|nr:protein-disulfide reductase DsbD domain-containing protein [Lichenihabitans sp.]
MVQSRSRLTGLLAVGLLLWTGSAAQAAATDWVGNKNAAVRLITAADHAGQGATVDAGLEFRFGPGWHGYWRTPGDAGLPPVIDWSGSTNLGREDLAWPSPTRLVVEGLQNSVYEGEVVLPATLGLNTPGDPAHIHVSVAYAACSEICVPYQADLALDLPAGSGGASAEAPLIAAARSKVPGSLDHAGLRLVSTDIQGAGAQRRLVATLRSAGMPFERPDLFVEGAGEGLPPAPDVALSEDGMVARLSVGLPETFKTGTPLTATLVDGGRAAEFAAGPAVPPPAQEAPAPASLSLWAIFASALFGGLILNLMPCVLPVLSIKLFGLTRHAGASRQAIRLGFVATALGIVASFLLLAGALVGLKWSGATLGWGIQFQQPWFLAGMASLTVLFAASFFDWLPIGLPGAISNIGGRGTRGSLAEAFMVGVFATLLATPCSAPFVGTAVGFALARGPAEIVGVFLCLGIGMALPYGAAALFPGLVRLLPRPGPWMIRLRQVLGVLLLGTAVWLLVVLSSIAGAWIADATAAILLALLAYRGWISRGAIGEGRPRERAVTAALVVAPLLIALLPVSASSRPASGSDWQAFDPDAVPGLVAEGKTVLVDVTATWCLTCKVNELAALGRPEVAARLARPDTVRMRADWSRPDVAIAAYLKRFGRYGIPLDVVYGPARPEGEALPELLTPGVVLTALDNAAGKRPATAAGID